MDKKEQMKLISYFIMGDGGVYTIKKNAKFIMNIKKAHLDYVQEFMDLIDFTGISCKDRPDYNTDGYTRQPQVRVETGCHPVFTKFRERIYTDKYKGLDPMYVKQIDWHCLAILFQADGCLHLDKRWKKNHYSATLNMKRLSYGDLKFLGDSIHKNLGLYYNINRQGKYYYIRFRAKSLGKFLEGISPYVHESFNYKIRTIDPAFAGGEIVCSAWEHAEADRNDRPTHESVE